MCVPSGYNVYHITGHSPALFSDNLSEIGPLRACFIITGSYFQMFFLFNCDEHQGGFMPAAVSNLFDIAVSKY